MRLLRGWIRVVGLIVPRDHRRDWIEEWHADLVVSASPRRHAWGALPDALYLRREGWTVDAMWRDLRAAVKGLVRKPFFTALAGLTLAIGIGANTAIFSVVDGVLLNPLPYPDADRLVSYNHAAPGLGVPLMPHSEGTYLHYSENVKALDAYAVFVNAGITLISDGEPRRLQAVRATADFFDVLALPPALGRAFLPGEDRPGAEPVVVLAHSLWEQAFGSDPEAIGRLVELDGVQHRIIGIMPETAGIQGEQLWMPITVNDVEPDVGSFGMIGVGRLAEGMTLDGAGTEMHDLMLRWVESNADVITSDALRETGLRADVKPLKDLYVQDIRQALWVLLGTVGFVLLIACANVANLFLVRAETRQREQALRAALGASRSDIVRQYLTESVTLALGGGVLGLALAALGVHGLLALAPVALPSSLQIGIDGSVLAFTAVISVVSGVLFGLFPVIGYARPDLTGHLKEGGRSATTGRGRHRARSTLVVAQVALALVLLVGSGLMFRSFSALRDVDLGFVPENRLTFRVGLPQAEFPEARQTSDFFRELEQRLAAAPGVRAVGMTDGLPLTDQRSAGPMEPVDRPFPSGELGPLVERRAVTPGFFEVLGVDVLEGRGLTWDDAADAIRGVVISRALASAFWPGESAVGQRIQDQGGDGEPWEIVGVVSDMRFEKVETEPAEIIYYPTIKGPREAVVGTYGMDVTVHTAGSPLEVVQSARDALRAVGPRIPLINPRTLTSVVEDSMATTSFTVVLLGIAAGVALLLGTVGIYGVISYIVSRRVPEIGVRIALGATASTVLRSVVGEGLRLTAIGVFLGLLGSWVVSRALASLLYGVSSTDPVTLVGMALVLTAVATFATWVPARRASRIDPVEALRAE